MSKINMRFAGEVTAENLKARVIRMLEVKGSPKAAEQFKNRVKNITNFRDVYEEACSFVIFPEETISFFIEEGVM